MGDDQHYAASDHGHLRPGDTIAIANKHNELNALLEYICLDGFQPFGRLRSESQRHLLRLARSASIEIGDLLQK